MPAMNPGNTAAEANPSTGKAVLMSPFSGPTGSPFDEDSDGNASTGALSTGIGFGLNSGAIGYGPDPADPTLQLITPNYTPDVVPGVTMPDGVTAATTAVLLAIGGGKSSITVSGGDYAKGESNPDPYDAQPLLAFGNGIERDAGAGPAFTGHALKVLVNESGAEVADDGVVALGFTNETGAVLPEGYGVHASETADSAAVT